VASLNGLFLQKSTSLTRYVAKGELGPTEIGESNGKILKGSLSDEADLNKSVVCIKLSSDNG
jgi:hypothetical protein